MTRISFLLDGERDELAVPNLVTTLIHKEVSVAQTTFWKQGKHLRTRRFHKLGRGYERTLKLVVRQAIDQDCDGVVAVIDRDKGKDARFAKLRAAREDGRAAQDRIPTAIGEANPHLEVWLLDDPKAVKTALGLHNSHEVPAVTKLDDSPKNTLDAMVRASSRAGEKFALIAGEIASEIDLGRCNHANHTGFADFADDVSAEFAGHIER